MFLLLIVCTVSHNSAHNSLGGGTGQKVSIISRKVLHGAKLERGSEPEQRSCVEECPLLSGVYMED